jgi:hypothetical protein
MASVEQKNWTHVRKVVGFRRFDSTGELRVRNETYGVLRLHKNACLQTNRLQSECQWVGESDASARPPARRTNTLWTQVE